MEDKQLILEYKGHLTFSTIGRLLTMLKHKMVQNSIKVGKYKRILSVMIEALENVYKNSDAYHENSKIRKDYLPEFKLFRNEHKYIIAVSNPIRNTEIPYLKAKLDLVNTKTTEELKMLYRQIISDGKFTAKGGAGLGIIEMVKISGNPLSFSFTPIDNDFSLYNLKIIFD